MPSATKRNTSTRTPARTREPAPLATWRAGFLAAFALTGNVTAAAKAAGIERSTAYRAKEADPSFAADWAEAQEVASDALEEEARRLATGHYVSYKFDKNGNPLLHPVTGEPYTERVISTPLLTLLLKAERPDKFKDRSLVETVAPAAPKYDLSKLTPEQLAQLEALTRAATPPELP
jgi:hypothetical protein